MQLSLYNTLSETKETFNPIDRNLIKMYVCGPTVYDRPHIGNARSVVVYDVLYRILIHIFGKNSVLYIRNITDVDDKIINQANVDNITISELTKRTTEYFHSDTRYINCLSPNIEPKATEHIKDMISMIEKLIERGHAYIANKHVYFDVLSVKDYTKLSGRSLDEMLDSVRINKAEAKKHPGDFVLWKPYAGGNEAEVEFPKNSGEEYSASFDSPWGRGRPGWHIECSAMSCKYLGPDFDIHGGGADLIFPHHTNEIAQSVCSNPGSSFAKYWVHNGFLTSHGEKMSKSLGNFVTVQDLIQNGISGDVIRLFLLSAHYRKPLDFNEKAIDDSTKMLNYWYRAIEDAKEIDQNQEELPDNFITSLLDDINTPLAIKIINDYAKLSHKSINPQEKQANASIMFLCAKFLGLMSKSAKEWFHTEDENKEVDILIQQRARAKQEKNWKLADEIRANLQQQGIILEDTAEGTIWKRKV